MIHAPNLSSLLPTAEAFSENVKRAHLQTYLWKNELQLRLKSLEGIGYNEQGYDNESLRPTSL